MSLFRGMGVKPGTTLIIFDSIQACDKAMDSLGHFYDNAPEYHVIAAGTLLGTAISEIETLTLFPMNFYEFLLAQNSMLAMHLKESSFRDDALRTLKRSLKGFSGIFK